MRLSSNEIVPTTIAFIVVVILSSPKSVKSSSAFISSFNSHNNIIATGSNYCYTKTRYHHHDYKPLIALQATLEETSPSVQQGDNETNEKILQHINSAVSDSKQWGNDFNLDEESVFYSLFSAIRSSAVMGLRGRPFHLKQSEILDALSIDADSNAFKGYFTYEDLSKAVEDDFLDASRGTTNNREGWKVSPVSQPRGDSFEDARMTLEEINAALEKGTVIFNTAGAHIPKLARATFALTDASALPCAINLYITAANKRTSAPPHTDRQDVIIVQTEGRKHWRVYTPPNPALKPSADMYARGKGDDSMPLYSLEDPAFGCKKLLDVTLEEGDILFMPAGFPHSTDTVNDAKDGKTSIHLTFNFDTHVWDLDYLSVRRLALRRAGVADSALGQEKEEDNRYVGNVNLLPEKVRDDLLEALPLGFLEEEKTNMVDEVTKKLEQISQMVDQETYDAVPSQIWRDTVERVRLQGIELLDIHRDMYLAAIDEGRARQAEEEMTAHITVEAARAKQMSQDKIQRMSVFRVPKFYEKVDESKASLMQWSFEGDSSSSSSTGVATLPDDWEFTSPLAVGDQVEADLGGAFFEATVTKVANSKYDVRFFDGDVMNGLDRSMIKLLNPPSLTNDNDDENEEQPPPGLTKKQLKKWLKKQEKKMAKKGF